MVKFMYLQSIINYRIPINDDGTVGNPEVESKWTTERHTPKKKSKVIPTYKPEEAGETYL
jgi:hypothetical protein